MSKIKPVSSYKPVYQSQTDGVWHDVRKADFDARSHCPDLFKQRILYPAAAYEAMQKENETLIQKLETAAFNHFAAQERIEAQAKQIEELENDLVEWNEFKKIRDTQMQALGKQMS